MAVFRADPPYAFVANVAVPALKPRDVVVRNGTVFVIPQNSGNHTTILNETETKSLGLEQEVADVLGRHLAHLQHPTNTPPPGPMGPPLSTTTWTPVALKRTKSTSATSQLKNGKTWSKV